MPLQSVSDHTGFLTPSPLPQPQHWVEGAWRSLLLVTGAGDLSELRSSCLKGEHSHPLSCLFSLYTTVIFRKINFSFPNLPSTCRLYTSTDLDPSINLIRNFPSRVKVTGIS